MGFFDIIGNALIEPLKLVFEFIFSTAARFIDHPGLCIIVLSLAMNILVLPLYRRADAMQEAARDTDNKLHKGVSHIKKTFSGNERMMILQTYYRQNHYKPTHALNGSVSLLLEIPFFMAAYQFLSGLDILRGVSFGPIQDLGAPDGLLTIGGLSINLLPILMTVFNVVSSYLYLKGFPLKTKIQLYGMAGFFLVFLYTSPSSLVFYWTLNNVFSLVKTIFYKLKNPRRVINVITTLAGLGFLVLSVFYEAFHYAETLFLIGLGVALLLPALIPFIKSKLPPRKKERPTPQPSRKIFVLGCLFLTVLVGMLIPSAFVAASPQEYVDITHFFHPLWYVLSALSLSAGFFLVWMGVFYWLATPGGKVIFERLVWILSGMALVNYMFFGTNLGVISSTLQYEGGLILDGTEILVNALVLIALIVLFALIIVKWKKVASLVLATAIIAVSGMSGVNMVTANQSVQDLKSRLTEETLSMPEITLSKSAKNVMVIMLDRAVGTYIPYIFKEKPELVEQFSGFTHYTNTISFGGYTNFGTPSLLGGYEYTPVEMNKRDDEALVDKHNEAHKVMPTLFSQAGFNVSLIDPIYSGYQWVPDLSVFDDIPNTDAQIAKGKFDKQEYKQLVIESNLRNFFCFGLTKSMPLCLQWPLYDEGRYNQVNTEKLAYGIQRTTSKSKGNGLSSDFMNPYNVLLNLSNITRTTEDEIGSFLFMTNDLPHEPMLLQTPDYTPAGVVDNTAYDAENTDRWTVDGKTMHITNADQMSHYHANMAAMIQLGKWFDHLREQGVYDNTRIILVADHGRGLKQLDELMYTQNGTNRDLEMYQPLLMVKDFGDEGFKTDSTFMTNADVPVLAMEGVIAKDKQVNPFTHKPINSDEKHAHDQIIILSSEWDVSKNNGNTYHASQWASVKDNLWNKDNWKFYEDKYIVLKEHKLP